MKGTWVKWVKVVYEVIPKMFLQKGLDGVNRKGKINRREGVPQTRDTAGKRVALCKCRDELRLNLDDSTERVLDEQKENGRKMRRLCIGFLMQETKNKISFGLRVYISGRMESETSLSL